MSATAPKARRATGRRSSEKLARCRRRLRALAAQGCAEVVRHAAPSAGGGESTAPVRCTPIAQARAGWARPEARTYLSVLGGKASFCSSPSISWMAYCSWVSSALSGRHVDRRAGGRLLLGAAADLTVETGLAEDLVAALELVRDIFGDDDVGLDAGRLDRAVVRRVVARRGQPDAAIGAELDDRLHACPCRTSGCRSALRACGPAARRRRFRPPRRSRH